ncbi:MAG: LysM peptidoglycan-binding domain-containing protein [Kineosporiaceae bacterium]|nr:LysM peptidoglycan-binding domain-containing protein [Kineosporiaceae bacterium]MBK7623482.1 LysM peptidoglycan-binding domain-containing protein [Kineosporiaceae bacterium]MBK8073974.1 LysM peptidoglycan-binding domain-containing protein [Kineosporiaceae bacterium]
MRRRLTGAFAVLAIIAVVAGVPLLLIAIGAGPVPDLFTSWSRARAALTAPDDGTLLLALARLVAWGAWLVLTAALVVEIGSRLRGLPVPHWPALSVPQGLARSLVTAAAATFLVAQPASAAPMPQPALSSISLSVGATGPLRASMAAPAPVTVAVTHRAGPASPPTAPATVMSASRDEAVHVVAHGETLWTIAERYLGDGARFGEIARLNYGRVQADGEALTDSHWITPGWRLVVPSRQTGRATPTPAARPDSDTATGDVATPPHIVADGESLWDIAEDRLGDGQEWPRLFQSSQATVQPDGGHLTDPDLLRPGWIVTLPDDAAEPTAEPTAVVDPAWGATPAAALPAPAPSVPTPPVPTPPVVTSSVLPDDGLADGAPWLVRTGSGVGALLAAGLVGTLGARRRLQDLRRRPGQRAASLITPPAISSTENALHVVADPLGVATVDMALRTLARDCHAAGRHLPAVRAVRLTPSHLELYLAEPAVLPSGWTTPAGSGEGTVWRLQPDEAPVADARQLADIPAPYPALVTLGHDPDDAHFLVDLEYLGGLGLTGPPDRTRAALAAITVELATSSWADDVRLTVVGEFAGLEDVLSTGRIRYQPALGRVVEQLAARASRDRELLASCGLPDVRSARAAASAADTWIPEILLIAGPLDAEQHRQIADVLPSLAGTAHAVVVAGQAPGPWSLEIPADDRPGLLAPIGVTLRPQVLEDAVRHDVLQLIALADPDRPADEPVDGGPGDGGPSGGRHVAMPTEPTLTDLATVVAIEEDLAAPVPVAAPAPAPDTTHPVVRVLGTVRIDGARGSVEPSRRARLTELITYLALHPGAAHREIDEAIWPDRRTEDNLNTRHTATSKARSWLGRTDDDEDYLPRHAAEREYRLLPQVRTDWQLWLDLVADGAQATSTQDLETALALVRSRPFDGVHPKRYAWADRIRRRMITEIVDAAHEVGRRRLTEGRYRAAEAALAVGLAVEPGWEPLWRLRILTAHQAGNRAAVTEAIDRLLAITEALGSDLEPETLALLAAVRPNG